MPAVAAGRSGLEPAARLVVAGGRRRASLQEIGGYAFGT